VASGNSGRSGARAGHETRSKHILTNLSLISQRARARAGEHKEEEAVRRKIPIAAALGVVGAAVWITPAWAQEGELTPDVVQIALDNTYVLMAAVLVIFMQAGFALVEAGLTRAKSVGNIMMKNLIDFCAGVIAFFCVGYAIAFGSGNDFFGTHGWFLENTPGYGTLTLPTFFIFQVAFAGVAATIVSGAMAERTKFKSYLVYSVVISAVIYPVVVHWFWGGGWLAQLDTPFLDFAGSTIVHSVGGWAALVGVLFLGPRIGKYGPDGKPRTIHGHSLPFAVLGTLILLVGWYGFNPGSQLAADPVVGKIALTTTLAAVAGALAAMFMVWAKSGKPDVAMTANGMLAGLVAITAGCAFVDAWAALVIGALAGLIVVWSVHFFDSVKIDDPVGAISVHGVCGAWGTLAVGLFATEGGLFLGDGADQLVSQIIGVVAVFAWVVVTCAILFGIIRLVFGLRVSAEEELIGLDEHEHGTNGYADFVFVEVEEEVPVDTMSTS
jgi:Amt family ammonium transporter